ncbi:hypothetical protein [Nostoc sp.]|uniref:hypothetical protein n=1 Tax=Nostoc sp. TaxID=1180 RepID=UPI002FF638B9
MADLTVTRLIPAIVRQLPLLATATDPVAHLRAGFAFTGHNTNVRLLPCIDSKIVKTSLKLLLSAPLHKTNYR